MKAMMTEYVKSVKQSDLGAESDIAKALRAGIAAKGKIGMMGASRRAIVGRSTTT